MGDTTALGEFEQLVLLAILRLGETAYGVSIRRELLSCALRQVSPGALYTTLDRLEQKGLITSEEGTPTPERGGRGKALLHRHKDRASTIDTGTTFFPADDVGIRTAGKRSWIGHALQRVFWEQYAGVSGLTKSLGIYSSSTLPVSDRSVGLSLGS